MSQSLTTKMTRLTQAHDRIMFVDEVAERLGRSPAQLRWMLSKSTAPKHAKIAGRICFRESDVETYIEAAFSDDAA